MQSYAYTVLRFNSDRFTCVCLIKLYKDSVEETIKENVTIGGQEWDSVSRAEVSSSSTVQEGTCNISLSLNLTGKKYIVQFSGGYSTQEGTN